MFFEVAVYGIHSRNEILILKVACLARCVPKQIVIIKLREKRGELGVKRMRSRILICSDDR